MHGLSMDGRPTDPFSYNASYELSAKLILRHTIFTSPILFHDQTDLNVREFVNIWFMLKYPLHLAKSHILVLIKRELIDNTNFQNESSCTNIFTFIHFDYY